MAAPTYEVKTLKDYVDEALKTVKQISPEETLKLIGRGDWVILDVREPNEFAGGHLPKAINIPRGFLEVRADLEHHKRDSRFQDRNQRILCYCGGGHRSAMAAKVLQEMGFKEAVTMSDGWTGWNELGLPVEMD
jgi:rhodanese-related sulfurtransferase